MKITVFMTVRVPGEHVCPCALVAREQHQYSSAVILRTFSAVFIELALQGVVRVIGIVWLASCTPIPSH